MNTTARKKIVAARTALILDQPFFGALSLRLRLVEDPSCGTAWTDGVSLGYDPAFIEDLTHAETVALVAHEVMHCAAAHPWRRDAREPRKWNVAADRAVNPVLRDSGFTLPDGALYELDPSHAGKSAEWIYNRLPAADSGGGRGSGGTSGEGGETPVGGEYDSPTANPLGEVRDAPTSAAGDEAPDGEAEWAQAVQQAANAAKAQGKLPGSLKRFAQDNVAARVDWRSALRRFVQEAARSDYSWARPNARYLPGGLYLPSLRSEEMGPIAVAVDTSGSIDDVLLSQFEAELRSIVDEARPRSVAVLYCDAKVRRVDTFLPDDLITLDAVGGGGTSFVPVFRELDRLEEPPVCVVYLTDGAGTFPDPAPEVPTLWAMASAAAAPFGETVRVDG